MRSFRGRCITSRGGENVARAYRLAQIGGGATLRDTGLPVIIVTHTGNKTGAIRKTPLVRVKDGNKYVLVGSVGGAPKHPV